MLSVTSFSVALGFRLTIRNVNLPRLHGTGKMVQVLD